MSTVRTVAAWGVHGLTAFGGVFGFLALRAAFADNNREAFIMLAVAFAIDSIDGALARKVRVKQVIPWMDGTLLDNIIDYLNYVVVPVAIISRPGVLPTGLEWCALSILIASAYGFCRTDAKGLVDHYFQGFPSYWNVMAFYMVLLGTQPMTNLIAMLVGVVFVFIPMRWLYPSRMETGRAAFLGMGMLWAAIGIVLIAQMPEHSLALAWASLFYPVIYTAGSVVFHLRN